MQVELHSQVSGGNGWNGYQQHSAYEADTLICDRSPLPKWQILVLI